MTKANNPAAKAKASSSVSDPHPYNHYNLYFILERELFLQARGVYPKETGASHSQRSSCHRSDGSAIDYTGLDFPSLPSKYSSLILSADWFVHKKKKRAHVKSHGLVSFRGMAAMVSSNFKAEKSEIVRYVKTVANLMKAHFKKETMSNKSREAKPSSLPSPPPLSASPMSSSAAPLPDHLDSDLFEPIPVNSDVFEPIPANSSSDIEQDRVQRLMDYLADTVSPSPVYTPPSWSWEIDPSREEQYADMCFSVPRDHKLIRRSSTCSTITELDVPDEDIIKMWSS